VTREETPSSAADGASALADPDLCGEDIAYNAQRAVELAPRLCVRCEDFHMAHALRRASGPASGILLDRAKMIELVGRVIAGHGGGPVDILVAGAADTGLLALCAHAAFMAGPDTFRRARFTVLDLCETPLELCRDYARRHGLALRAEAVDLMETTQTYATDVFLHHSLFNFVPPDVRVRVLRKFGQWLTPGGRIVFSTSVNAPGTREKTNAFRAEFYGRIRSMIETREINLPESKSRFEARLDNNRGRMEQLYLNDGSDAQLRELFAAAGLSVDSFEHTFHETQAPSGAPFVRERVAAILARGAA
jgi:hypothetical protein